jgi:hypothetical protein
LTVGGRSRSVADLLDAIDPVERDGVRRTDLALVT